MHLKASQILGRDFIKTLYAHSFRPIMNTFIITFAGLKSNVRSPCNPYKEKVSIRHNSRSVMHPARAQVY